MEAQIKAFIVETFLYGEVDELSSTESLIESNVVDSTGFLELVTFVEEEFEIEVDDDELVPANFETIARLVAYVSRKRGVAAAA